MGAGATAIAPPLIKSIGIGWTATFLSGLWLLGNPAPWVVFYRGYRWRSELSHKHEQKSEKSSHDLWIPLENKRSNQKSFQLELDIGKRDGAIKIYSMFYIISPKFRSRPTKLLKARHLAPQLALHSTPKRVDDASAEDYACPSIFKKRDYDVWEWDFLLSFFFFFWRK